MSSQDNGKNNYDNPAEVMLLLAKEADEVITLAGKSARQEAAEETEKMLRQYEQTAKQIVLKIREEARTRADEMAARFRDALILRIEEASTFALEDTMKCVSVRAEEIIKQMQQAVKKETRQALAEGLVAGDAKTSGPTLASREEEKHAPKVIQPLAEQVSLVSKEGGLASETSEDFKNWLMQ